MWPMAFDFYVVISQTKLFVAWDDVFYSLVSSTCSREAQPKIEDVKFSREIDYKHPFY